MGPITSPVIMNLSETILIVHAEVPSQPSFGARDGVTRRPISSPSAADAVGMSDTFFKIMICANGCHRVIRLTRRRFPLGFRPDHYVKKTHRDCRYRGHHSARSGDSSPIGSMARVRA
jgi:hypothetical protein